MNSNSTTNKSLNILISDVDFDGIFYVLVEKYSNYYIVSMNENFQIVENRSIVPPQNFSYWWITGISVVNSEIFVLAHISTGDIPISQIWHIYENSSEIIAEINESWSEGILDFIF